METLLKFSFHCVLVCVITVTAVAHLPAGGPDNHNQKANTGRNSSVVSLDKEQLTREDVAQFLQEMKKLNKHVSSTPPSENATSQQHETSAAAVSTLFDTMIPLAIGVAAAGLLVILVTVVVIFVCCSNRKNAKQDLTLNKDLTRWDPQLLRPSKEQIDAFYFGPPIPSVAEMIKQ